MDKAAYIDTIIKNVVFKGENKAKYARAACGVCRAAPRGRMRERGVLNFGQSPPRLSAAAARVMTKHNKRIFCNFYKTAPRAPGQSIKNPALGAGF